MKTERVIIVDDEEIVRLGLENWLSRDFEVVGFDSAESFFKSYRQVDFEDGILTCILLDFQMPDMNGVELQRSLKEMNIKVPIIFMSGNAKQADIIDAWHEGAVDFVLKPFTPAQITEAITKVFASCRASLSGTISSDIKNIIDLHITKREAEVLLLLGNGKQQHEVAEQLGISLRTVKMFRTFLRDKLHLNTLGELIKFCQQHQKAIEKILSKS